MPVPIRLVRNLRILPFYAFLGDFILVAPVLVAWYTAHGMSATAVFTLQGLFALTVAVLEVPSGFVADALGRRRALAFGAAFWPVGLLLYRFGGSFAAFALAEITVAIGFSLQSGCLSAILYDSLVPLGRGGEYERREGVMSSTARWGSLVASLAAGALAMGGLAWPFNANLLSHSLLLPLALFLTEPQREKPPLRHAWSEILQVSRNCLGRPDLRLWILGAGLLGAVGMIVLWSSFLTYAAWNLPPAWNGVLFALFQLGGVLGGYASTPLRKRIGTRRFLFFQILPGPLLLSLSLWCRPAMIWVFPVMAFLWNLGLPFFYTGINHRTESRVRATVLSVSSLVGRMCFVAVAPIFGAVVDHSSLPVALGGLGILAFLGMGLILPRLKDEDIL